MLALFTKGQKLPSLDIEYSGKLQVRDLESHNLEELNILDFLLIEAIVVDLNLSPAFKKQWYKPFKDLMKQHLEKVGLQSKTCQDEQGKTLKGFNMNEFY